MTTGSCSAKNGSRPAPASAKQHGLDCDSDLDRELEPGHPAEPEADLKRNRAPVLNDEHDHAGSGDDGPDHHHGRVADEQAEEHRDHEAAERERDADSEQIAQEPLAV